MALRFTLFFLVFCGPRVALAGQAGGQSAGEAPVTPTATTSSRAAANAALPSATLQPSLEALQTALGEVRVDRWKGPGAMKSEAESNLGSIRRDVDSTLPPLLAAADAAPGAVAKVMPAYRNVEALYDVLLRVAIAGRLNAPGEQISALEQALARLDEGRRAFGDSLQAASEAEEKRASDLVSITRSKPTAFQAVCFQHPLCFWDALCGT